MVLEVEPLPTYTHYLSYTEVLSGSPFFMQRGLEVRTHVLFSSFYLLNVTSPA